jgi:hypothetical protein
MSEERDTGTLIWKGGFCWAQVRNRTSYLGPCSSEARAQEIADELCLRLEPGSEGMSRLRPYDWRPGQRN